ncbi:MAG: hypothetical protein WA743_08535 [Pseudolabrys sp.]
MTEVDVWIAMNEAGHYEVGPDEDSAIERWDENCGGIARRMVHLRLTMSAPNVPAVDASVPDDAGQTVVVKVDDDD